MTKPTPPEHLTALDWIAVALTILLVAGMVVLMPILAQRFSRLFQDFGATLPWITEWALSRWFAAPLLVPPVTLLSLGLGRRTLTAGQRRACIVGAFLSAFLGTVLWLAALYLPLYQMGQGISP